MKDYYFQAFCIKLKDKTLLISDVIFSGDEPNDEFWSLGNPALIVNNNGSITLELYDCESLNDNGICVLHEDKILTYTEPSDEILEQYNMFQISKYIDTLAA